MASPHAARYVAVLDRLFETYARQIDPMIAFVGRSLHMDDFEFKHPQTGEPLAWKDARRDEKLRRWAETAFRATVRAHACDVLRGYLPAATRTNVGMFGTGQAFEYLLTKMYSQDLEEVSALAGAMRRELEKLIPSFVKRAGPSEYLAAVRSDARALAGEIVTEDPAPTDEPVRLVDWDDGAEEKILAAISPTREHPRRSAPW
jgi:thymidylate synthase ThyX